MQYPLLIAFLFVGLSSARGDDTFRPAECEGTYPRHLQGICTNRKDAIYWCWTDALVKTDTQGRILARVPVADHHGDLCFHDGRVYVATNLGKFNKPEGEADSWVYIYDGNTLTELEKHRLPEVVHGAGGLEWHNGKFLVVGGLPPDGKENYLYEYDEKFRFKRRHILASGYTLMGIQTVAFADGAWWFGCYGNRPVLLRSDEKLQFSNKWEFNASVGLAPIGNGRFLIAQNTSINGDDGKAIGNRASVVIARVDEKDGFVIEKPQ